MDTYEKKYNEALERAKNIKSKILQSHLSTESCKAISEYIDTIIPELRESEDERIRKWIVNLLHELHYNQTAHSMALKAIEWLEKQKENPKNADSIPADCVSNAKCEDRWHKIQDSLPDNGRLVLANDCLGNMLLARYDGEGNWEVSVYDNDDYYCRNTITKWCDIPSEKQKEQKPAWSEEDERRIDAICELLENTSAIHPNYSHRKLIIWLKDLRPIKQEWSKKDEDKLYQVMETLLANKTVALRETPHCKALHEAYDEMLAWLKSLRPSWKPSEEQMDRLFSIVAALRKDYCDDMADFLANLYADLKKLGMKEEPEYYQHFDPDC